MFRESLIQEIYNQTDFPKYVSELQTILKKENLARKRFYKIVEENKKMEFINGEIYFQSPVNMSHNLASGEIYSTLRSFVTLHNLGFVGIEKILVSLNRNDYEADVVFFNIEKSKNFRKDQMQFPAPDFVVEVLSKSTKKNDRGMKFTDYAENGVLEYWIVNPAKCEVEQYFLKENKFELHKIIKKGTIKSLAVNGFEIKAANIFK